MELQVIPALFTHCPRNSLAHCPFNKELFHLFMCDLRAPQLLFNSSENYTLTKCHIQDSFDLIFLLFL